MEDNEQAILDWVNTFSSHNGSVTGLSDLFDGMVIAGMLSEIAPSSFDKSLIVNDSSGNWALSSSNFKTILRMLEDYYTNVVRKKIDMGSIDVNAIAREHNKDELFNVLELVVGCAVLSDNKAHFIQNIFSLDHESQTVLKGMVERVMRRTSAVDESVELSEGDHSYTEEEEEDGSGGSEELIRSREMVRYLQEEKAHQDQRVGDLERGNATLQGEVSRLKELLTRVEEERDVTEGSERNRALAVATASASLQGLFSGCLLLSREIKEFHIRSILRIVSVAA
eukprot:gene351-629_t